MPNFDKGILVPSTYGTPTQVFSSEVNTYFINIKASVQSSKDSCESSGDASCVTLANDLTTGLDDGQQNSLFQYLNAFGSTFISNIKLHGSSNNFVRLGSTWYEYDQQVSTGNVAPIPDYVEIYTGGLSTLSAIVAALPNFKWENCGSSGTFKYTAPIGTIPRGSVIQNLKTTGGAAIAGCWTLIGSDGTTIDSATTAPVEYTICSAC